MSFRATRQLRKSYSNEIHDALGDDAQPVLGICVSLQNGLKSTGGQMGYGGDTIPFQHQHKDQTSPSMLVPANRYEAFMEDPIDRFFARLLKQTDPKAAAALLVRRYGLGEYEVDSTRISVGWRRLDSGQREAYVFDKNGPVEPLDGYVRRAADVVLARAAVRASLPALYGNKVAGTPQPVNSFYRSDTGSFYGGHEMVPASSFYSNYSNTTNTHRQGSKDRRVEPAHKAGIVVPTTTSFVHQPSFTNSRTKSFMMPQPGSMSIPVAANLQAPTFVSVRG